MDHATRWRAIAKMKWGSSGQGPVCILISKFVDMCPQRKGVASAWKCLWKGNPTTEPDPTILVEDALKVLNGGPTESVRLA
jgi:hypothetical protein